jgi:hypothetical protein
MAYCGWIAIVVQSRGEACANNMQGQFEFRGKRRGDSIAEW